MRKFLTILKKRYIIVNVIVCCLHKSTEKGLVVIQRGTKMFGFDDKKKRILTISFIAYAVIFLLVILMMNFERFSAFTDWMNDKLSVFAPILLGAVFAYLCNPLVKFFQNVVLKRMKKPGWKRALSIVFAYVLIMVVIAVFAITIFPQLVSSINDLVTKLTDGTYLNMVLTAIENLASKIPASEGGQIPPLNLDKIYGTINDLWLKFQNIDILTNIFEGAEIIGSYASKVFNVLKNIFFGLLLSIYFTIGKEKIYAQTKKIMYAVFSRKRCDAIYDWFRFADRTFGGFIVGKILDALFMIFVCSIAFSIAKIPYAILIAVVIGVFNIIPFFGPFIGVIPSALIILIASPDKFILFIILLLVIQQIDANIVEPRIVGSRTGLSSLGVIVAILIMNGYFGLVGMFFGVPIFAILYSLVQKYIDIQLEKKQLETDIAEYYHESSLVDPRKESENLSSRFFKFVGRSIADSEHKIVKYVKNKANGENADDASSEETVVEKVTSEDQVKKATEENNDTEVNENE